MYRTEQDFFRAVNALESFIKHTTEGVAFATAKTTTNNWEKFKAEVERDGFITISTEGCENTIYSSPGMNVYARLWHDITHLRLQADFTVAGEDMVTDAQEHSLKLWMVQQGYDPRVIEHAGNVLHADIMGQADYYQKYNRFVPYQRVFVMNRFLNEY